MSQFAANTAGDPDAGTGCTGSSDRGSLLWYTVFTLCQHVKTAASTLEARGLNPFLPLVSEDRQWNVRKKKVCLPLFPGYVFVQMVMDAELQLIAKTVPGIVRFIGNQHGPLAIPQVEMESVRLLLSRGAECSHCSCLTAADRVRVVRGPLAGLERIFLRTKASTRIVVSVHMIQRAISVEVDARCNIEERERGMAAVYRFASATAMGP